MFSLVDYPMWVGGWVSHPRQIPLFCIKSAKFFQVLVVAALPSDYRVVGWALV